MEFGSSGRDWEKFEFLKDIVGLKVYKGVASRLPVSRGYSPMQVG